MFSFMCARFPITYPEINRGIYIVRRQSVPGVGKCFSAFCWFLNNIMLQFFCELSLRENRSNVGTNSKKKD